MSVYKTMERFIGDSHWQCAIEYLKQHPEKSHTFPNGDMDGPLILKDGWDYVVHRVENTLVCTTYYDKKVFSRRIM